MDTVNDRMQQIVDQMFDGNKAAFAKAIGLAPTSVSNYLGKQRASRPSADLLEKIVNSLDVDAMWLLTGKGHMERIETKRFEPDSTTNEELIRLRAENDVLRELAGLQKKNGLNANVG